MGCNRAASYPGDDGVRDDGRIVHLSVTIHDASLEALEVQVALVTLAHLPIHCVQRRQLLLQIL